VSFAPIPGSGTKTPVFGDSFGFRNAAFSRSIWRWTPTNKDHGRKDQANLSLPYTDMDSPETRSLASSIVPDQQIDSTIRDKILALVLSTCNISNYADVVSSFPSLKLLNGLMHSFLNSHFEQIDSWIHVPTFAVDEKYLEFLLHMIAAGAATSLSAPIRKLGFALQEAARIALSTKVRLLSSLLR
jgi:hypothetical protein